MIFEAQTEWIAPNNFPDLKGYKVISIDLETRDPNLIKMGSGSVTNRGDITGVAVAVKGWSGYYPIAHDTPPNMDKAIVTKWIKKQCSYEDKNYIFHNNPFLPSYPK